MSDMPGMKRPDIPDLPQIEDRMSFLYLEYCQLNRDNSAITVSNEKGTVDVPAASVSVLLLGPGTTVTHRAMELIGDAGMTVIWTGEHGVRYYAGGRPLTHRSHLLINQARLVSNTRSHLAVVRKMYQMRFPDDDVSTNTLQQLRGKEGARVRKIYREEAKKWNVPWNGREYIPGQFDAGTPVNRALTAGNMCLYGVAHAVIFALGCSPGLGFVHVGHENSFVYDIADLYKAEIIIPLAFELASQDCKDISGAMRRRTRDELNEKHILERMVKDIRTLLTVDGELPEEDIMLWDGADRTVQGGVSYGEEGTEA